MSYREGLAVLNSSAPLAVNTRARCGTAARYRGYHHADPRRLAHNGNDRWGGGRTPEVVSVVYPTRVRTCTLTRRPSTVIARFNSVKTIRRCAVYAPAYRQSTSSSCRSSSSCNLVISNTNDGTPAPLDNARSRTPLMSGNKSALIIFDSGQIFFLTSSNSLSNRILFFFYRYWQLCANE